MSKYFIEPHEPRPLRWWYDIRDKIDFEPTYQRRGKIWPIKNKSYLIDSILNKYDIPKFYVADFRKGYSPLNTKNKTYAIIDGKQRFEAIAEFYSDELAIGEKRDFIYGKNPNLKLQGMRYSDLRAKYPKIAEEFDTYQIDVISVWTERKGFIEELFLRLNASNPVNGAECRNAMQGIVMDLTREIALHPFFKKNIRFDIKRLADHNAAIKLLWIEFNGKLSDTKKAELDEFAIGSLKDDFDLEKCRKAAQRVHEVLAEMKNVFLDRDPLLSSSGTVPLYYWFIKHSNNNDLKKVRNYLEKFEEERKDNVRRKENGQTDVDNELLLFDKQRRSPNDSSAMKSMIDTLVKYFKKK